jgi:hypothetical protein
MMSVVKLSAILCCLIELNFTLELSTQDLSLITTKITNIQNGSDGVVGYSEMALKILKNIPIVSTRKQAGRVQVYACNACFSVFDEFLYLRREELLNDTSITNLAIEMCTIFELQPERVCTGVVNLNAPSILHIVDNRPELTADIVCKFIFNDGDCVNPSNDNKLEFTIDIDDTMAETVQPEKSPADDMTIIHLTDIHVDLKYAAKSLAACDAFACCRDMKVDNETNVSELAGYWGDYRNCDTPLYAVEDTLRHIVKTHTVSFFGFLFFCNHETVFFF